MPFPPSCTNFQVDRTTGVLSFEYDNKITRVQLNKYLKNKDGRFVWDSTGGFMEGVKPNTLEVDQSGILRAELKMKTGSYARASIKLSEKVIKDNSGVYGVSLEERTDGTRQNPDPIPRTSDTPPPAYDSEFYEGYRQYKAQTTFTSQSYAFADVETRSSLWLKYCVVDLKISGAILTAEIRLTTGGTKTSTFNLTNHIGVVRGKLVWGQRDFLKDCDGSVELKDRFTLRAKCFTDKKRGQTEISTLDLSRYLQVFDDELNIKVDTTEEVSEAFSGEKWSTYRVVKESSPELLQFGAFGNAFRSIAETVIRHVVKEVTGEVKSDELIRKALENSPQKVVETVQRIVDGYVKEVISGEIEQAFEDAKKALDAAKDRIVGACNTITSKSVRDTEEELKGDNGPTVKALSKDVDRLMTQSLEGVSALTIAQFQTRAEILMEQELFRATLRSARTQANLLYQLATQVECSMGIGLHTNWEDIRVNTN